jgi:hypothetical protein
MNDYYVYLYLHPETKDIIYVGKGRGNRDLQHLQDSSLYNLNTRFYVKLREMVNNQQYPLIRRIANNLMEKEAIELETEMIEIYGLLENGGTLLNIRGCGIERGTITTETRQKMSIAHKGSKQSKLTIAKKIIATTGLKRNKEAVQNLIKGSKKRHICSFDLKTGKVYQIYQSTQEAERQGFNHTSVWKCLTGRIDKYYNRGWRYLTSEEILLWQEAKVD